MAEKLKFSIPTPPARKPTADFRALDAVPVPDDSQIEQTAERLAAETRAYRETAPASEELVRTTRAESPRPPPARSQSKLSARSTAAAPPGVNLYVGGRAQKKTTLVMPVELAQQLSDLAHRDGTTLQSLIFRALVETYGLEIDPRELVADRRRRY